MRQEPYSPTDYNVASFKGNHTSYGKNDPMSGFWLMIVLAPIALICSCFDCVCQRHPESDADRYGYGFPSEAETPEPLSDSVNLPPSSPEPLPPSPPADL